MKSTKRSLLMSVLSLILCFTMLLGTTFAWFTDSVTSGKNRIVAGNLDVDLVMYKGSSYISIAKEDPNLEGDIFREASVAKNDNATLWEPGKTQYVWLGVQNKGTLALKYQVVIDVVDDPNGDGIGLARASKDGSLASALEYAIIDGAEYGAELDAQIQSGKWAGLKGYATAQTGDVLAGRQTADNGVLDEIVRGTPNETDFFLLAVHMKEEAGNEYQKGDAVININIVATQKDAESDSFGPDYDELSSLPNVPEYISGTGSSKGLSLVGDDLKEDGAAVSDNKVDVEVKTTVKTETETGSQEFGTVGSASVPADAAVKLLKDTFGDNGDFKAPPEATEGKDVETKDVLVLTLNVETLSADTVSMAIDVSMLSEATRRVTVTEGGVVTELPEQKVTKNLTEFSQPVTVVLNLAAGLEKVKVTHTHEDEAPVEMDAVDELAELADGKFYYEKDSGALNIMTSKFSVFDVSYIAPELCKIGSTPYSSLEAAVAAAKEGDVILLTKDITGATIKKDVTVTSNGAGLTATVAAGKTLTVTEGTFPTFNITKEKTTSKIVVTGGEFGMNPSAYTTAAYDVVPVEGKEGWFAVKESDAVIKRVTSAGAAYNYSSFVAAWADLTKGDTLYVLKDHAVGTQGYHYDFDINNTNFTIHVMDGVTLEFLRITDEVFCGNPGSATIKLEGTGTIKANCQYFIYAYNYDVKVSAKDITFIGNSSTSILNAANGQNTLTITSGNYKCGSLVSTNAKATVSGGRFMYDVNQYCASGKGATPLEDDPDGYQYLVENLNAKNAAIVVTYAGQDPVGFAKFPEYGINGSTGVSIKLNRDITDRLYLENSHDVVIDLNGHTWKGQTGSTSNLGQSTNCAIRLGWNYPSTNVTIKNGTIKTGEDGECYGLMIGKNCTGVVLEDVTLSANTYYGYPIYYPSLSTAESQKNTGAELTIKSGTYTASHQAVFKEVYAGALSIEGGTFSSGECYKYLASGKVLVAEGAQKYVVKDIAPASYTASINNKVYFTYAGGANDAIKLVSSGDTLYLNENATQEFKLGKGETLTVYYGEEITWSGIKAADGYELVPKEESGATEYTVKVIVNFTVIHNGVTTEYATMEDAVKAASGGDTIKLMRDYTTSSSVTIYNKVTFDLNGFTYTSTYSATQMNKAAITSHHGSGTSYIKDSSVAKTGKIYAPNCANALMKGESSGAKGELQISDVTLEGRDYGFYSQYGTVNIYSGTFIGSSGAIRVGGVGVNDGKYFKVSGGTFSSDISKITTSGYSIASDKSLVDNCDGTWTVN